jgi:hypothetical protein
LTGHTSWRLLTLGQRDVTWGSIRNSLLRASL